MDSVVSGGTSCGIISEIGKLNGSIVLDLDRVSSAKSALCGCFYSCCARKAFRFCDLNFYVFGYCFRCDLRNRSGQGRNIHAVGSDIIVKSFQCLSADFDAVQQCGFICIILFALCHQLFACRFADRFEAVSIAVSFTCSKQIFGKGCLSAACGSKSHLCIIDRQNGIVCAFDLIRMFCCFQCFLCAVQCTHLQQVILCVNQQSVTVCIGYCHPSDIGLVSGFLSVNIIGKLFIYGAVPYTDIVSGLSVAVAVRLAAAIPGQVVQSGCQLQACADSLKVAHVGVRSHGCFYNDLTVCIDCISDAVFGIRTVFQCTCYGNINHFVFFINAHFIDLNVLICCFPFCIHGFFFIIIRRSSPVVRLNAFCNHFFSV